MFELLVRGIPETLTTIQAIVITLAYTLELEDKTLLLRTPHTLMSEHGGIMLVLT